MAEKAGLGPNVKNHSGRKTMMQTLTNKNIPPTDIIQPSGHKNLQSMTNYSVVSERQHIVWTNYRKCAAKCRKIKFISSLQKFDIYSFSKLGRRISTWSASDVLIHWRCHSWWSEQHFCQQPQSISNFGNSRNRAIFKKEQKVKSPWVRFRLERPHNWRGVINIFRKLVSAIKMNLNFLYIVVLNRLSCYINHKHTL